MNALLFAAIYRRVSTDQQDASLAGQEQRVLAYCAYKQLTVKPEHQFSDPDTSGSIPMRERAGGDALWRLLEFGSVQHLVVAKLDRLGRNVRDALGVMELMDRRGIVLHIVDFGGESISTQGHMGKLIMTILLAVSEWELNEIRDRTRKGMAQLFSARQLTGHVPFGFDVRYTFADGHTVTAGKALSPAALGALEQAHGPATKPLIDNPAEQAVIRLMWGWAYGEAAWARPAVHGNAADSPQLASFTAIAHRLNELGYTTKQGKSWASSAVDSVLKNRYTRLVLDRERPPTAGGVA